MGKRTFLNSLLEKLKPDFGFGKSLVLGFVISASGSLMIGALHLIAIQINIEKGWQAAILFSCGCALVEAIFVRYVVSFTSWLAKRKNAMWILEIVLLILFFAMSIISFYAAMNISPEVKAVITPALIIPTFFLGIGIRFLYPSMIPFWLAWNAVLVTRKIRFKLLPFVVGTGVATVAMHAIYIFAGQLFVDFLSEKKEWMLYGIGWMFFLTGVFQLKRMFLKNKKKPINQI